MRYLNGYTIGGVLFAIVGAAALIVNTLIIAHSGDMRCVPRPLGRRALIEGDGIDEQGRAPAAIHNADGA